MSSITIGKTVYLSPIKGREPGQSGTYGQTSVIGRERRVSRKIIINSSNRGRLRILHLENNSADTKLVQRTLKTEGIACVVVRVESRDGFVSALNKGGFDLILADHSLPGFDGSSALAMARKRYPDVPFIFISGTYPGETAVELIKAGATDYVLKSRPYRLVLVIRRALQEVEAQTQRKRAQQELKALHDIYVAMTSTLDLSEILQIMLERIDDLLPYAAAHVRLLNRATGKIEPIACRNLDEAQWKRVSRSVHRPIHRTIIESQRPHVIRNMQQDERVSRREFYRRQGLVSCLAVPLAVGGKGFGVLSLFTKHEHEFTREEIDFAETLAEQAGIAIHNCQLYEQTKKLSHDLANNEKQIRNLAAGLMNAQDEEAKRIAQVLHDESGQLLANVYITLDEIAKRVSAPIRQEIDTAKKLLDQIENRLRYLSHELHPAILDNLGLVPSLEFLAGQIAKRKSIQIAVESELSGRLSPPLELTLYRVAQEALNNMARHAQASRAHVRLLEKKNLVHCSIRDNGVGFDAKAFAKRRGKKREALGMEGMRERVEAMHGTFQVLSPSGSGTELLVTIPKKRVT
jgi:signal transduction histidine kinase